jgi:hypothetical protein
MAKYNAYEKIKFFVSHGWTGRDAWQNATEYVLNFPEESDRLYKREKVELERQTKK